jgi:hypothetical protein
VTVDREREEWWREGYQRERDRVQELEDVLLRLVRVSPPHAGEVSSDVEREALDIANEGRKLLGEPTIEYDEIK